MISFTEYAKKYAASHENPTARHIHMIAIPLIFLSLMILLGFVRIIVTGILDVSLTDMAIIALLIYYARLNWRLTLGLIPIFIVFIFVANMFTYDGPNAFGLWSFFCIFLFGAVLQMIGYFIEGKRPAYIDMLWQILIAPLCFVAALFFKMGRMPVLKEAIYGKGSK